MLSVGCRHLPASETRQFRLVGPHKSKGEMTGSASQHGKPLLFEAPPLHPLPAKDQGQPPWELITGAVHTACHALPHALLSDLSRPSSPVLHARPQSRCCCGPDGNDIQAEMRTGEVSVFTLPYLKSLPLWCAQACRRPRVPLTQMRWPA